ncbi:hypothetical protein DY000_02009042 [Brassica cretica]|uniref:Uncharacterized protein n=1 Tax=Brassica cretica TaxID=69181 RepID=A0ABQ7C6H2_BRACR|nr:hypothetical protein DY000_02009042 [Brassica cretica]
MLSVGRSGDDEAVVFERPARRRGKGFGRGGQVATVMRHRKNMLMAFDSL